MQGPFLGCQGCQVLEDVPCYPIQVLEEIASFLIQGPYIVAWGVMELHDLLYEGHTLQGYNREMWFALFDRLGVL